MPTGSGEMSHAATSCPSDWVRALPKAEVHLHLEGCVPLGTVGLDDPGRAGVDLDPDTGAPRFGDLAEFLAFLDRSCALVTERGQVERIAYEITLRAASEGVGHTDVTFNPTHWHAWRSDLAAFVTLLDAGFAAGEADHGVTVGLCLSLKRTQPPGDSVELVDWLLDMRPDRVVALSVDGNEAAAGRTAERFAPLFDRARRAGLHTCAHAGESSGPEGVWDAIDLLRAERVDHGIRAVEDSSLVAELTARAIPLDVCPTSNVRLGVVAALSSHPIERLRAAGVRVSVNTDDPLLFGTSVTREYTRCAEAFSWDREVLGTLARTSIESSFAPPERKQELRSRLDQFLATSSAGPR
ncbi:MAG TPA: adenosine deaminase [Acidimicrobiales bacterium]|nr:adenosine deaminase [Acidimicrobiales bacterium]